MHKESVSDRLRRMHKVKLEAMGRDPEKYSSAYLEGAEEIDRLYAVIRIIDGILRPGSESSTYWWNDAVENDEKLFMSVKRALDGAS